MGWGQVQPFLWSGSRGVISLFWASPPFLGNPQGRQGLCSLLFPPWCHRLFSSLIAPLQLL